MKKNTILTAARPFISARENAAAKSCGRGDKKSEQSR